MRSSIVLTDGRGHIPAMSARTCKPSPASNPWPGSTISIAVEMNQARLSVVFSHRLDPLGKSFFYTFTESEPNRLNVRRTSLPLVSGHRTNHETVHAVSHQYPAFKFTESPPPDRTCEHCLKSFSSKSIRDRHVREQHTSPKRFFCPEATGCERGITGRGFTRREHRLEHLITVHKMGHDEAKSKAARKDEDSNTDSHD